MDPLGCEEKQSRVHILENLEIANEQCFKITGIGEDCELEFKTNYTVNDAMEICLNIGNTALNIKDVLILKCRKQCMTQHKITIEQNGIQI